MQALYLPNECTEQIIIWLPPLQRWQIATHLRFTFIQRRCLTLIATSENACIELLEAWKADPQVKIKFSVHILFKSSIRGHIATLEWWKRYCADADINVKSLLFDEGKNLVDLVRLEQYDDVITTLAALYEMRTSVLHWWIHSGFFPEMNYWRLPFAAFLFTLASLPIVLLIQICRYFAKWEQNHIEAAKLEILMRIVLFLWRLPFAYFWGKRGENEYPRSK